LGYVYNLQPQLGPTQTVNTVK